MNSLSINTEVANINTLSSKITLKLQLKEIHNLPFIKYFGNNGIYIIKNK